MLRPKLNRIWASTSANTRRDPGDAKYIQGWISEIPTYQVLNYLQYKIDTTLLALAERGFFEWGSDIQYGSGSVVWDELTKKIYVSLVGSPDKTKAPSQNLSQWAESSIQIPRANYDAAVAAINAHIADVTGNPHKLTAGRLNAYNKAEIDAIVATYRNLVSAHALDKNNPHGVTALQVGAVPITGGTYTGDVIFNGGLYFDAGKVNQISKANGLFLQTGNFVLGINASGVAVAGTTNSQSPIVTEATFASLKAGQEPNYAVPEPTFEMSLINSINMKNGVGNINSDFSLGFSPSLGTLVMSSGQASSQTLITEAAQMPPSNATWTMAIDVASTTPAIEGNGNYSFAAIIEGKGDITILANGGVTAHSAGGGSTPVVGLGHMSSLTRLVLVSAGSNLLLYVDGILRANITNAVQGNAGGRAFLRTYGGGNLPVRTFYLRNWRVWQSDALSAAQVSTL